MATSVEFFEYVMDQLSRVGEFSARKMMGEYIVYYRGKLVGDICDNQLFLKPTDSVLRKMPDADRGYPYEGSKTLMVIVSDFEDIQLLSEVFNAMYDELPDRK